jgi:succinate dehydrogenase/fumarate reductase flavoprotein subunit
MRKRVKQAGAKIFDHSPALELLVDADGVVSGASGLHRQTGERWTIHAGAVVIATGGCAFLSGALGCNVLTGDGYLMAAETGAELSGMEFSNAYAMSTEYGSVTKTLFYNWATFTHEDGRPVEGAKSKGGRSVIAKELGSGRVFAQLDKADEQTRAAMRLAQPNFFLPLDRAGIDPFSQRFPITLRLEGTVRGTGGLRIVDETCATTVPGLYAAGDAATRELICGAFTGGGSHNCAWAMSSGAWAGEAAGQFSKQRDAVDAQGANRAGDIGLRDRVARSLDASQLTKDVQAEVVPYERNYFRNAERLESSLSRLDALWDDATKADAAETANVVKTRESAAMLATARWMYRSASSRTESRGMARRLDHPHLDKAQRRSIHTGGLREVWTRPGPVAPEPFVEAAE